MKKQELKNRLVADRAESIGEDNDDVSLVSVSLPKVHAPRRVLHRAIGFWPATIERCRDLETNQAIKVRLLPGEQPNNFAAMARSVAKNKGFYLNAVYKHPFMYLWRDRMRGNVLPEDFNSKGAVFFDEVHDEQS